MNTLSFADKKKGSFFPVVKSIPGKYVSRSFDAFFAMTSRVFCVFRGFDL